MIVAKVYKPFPCPAISLSVGVKSPMVVNRRAAKSAVRRHGHVLPAVDLCPGPVTGDGHGFSMMVLHTGHGLRVHLECTLCCKWASLSNHKKNGDTTSEPPLNSVKTSAADFLLPALSRPRREEFPSESLSRILCPGSCTRLIKFKWDGVRRSTFIQRSTLYLKCSDNRHSILVVYSPVII